MFDGRWVRVRGVLNFKLGGAILNSKQFFVCFYIGLVMRVLNFKLGGSVTITTVIITAATLGFMFPFKF